MNDFGESISDETEVFYCQKCGILKNKLQYGSTCNCNTTTDIVAVSGDVLLKGWQCPFCKTVYSPYKETCLCQIGGTNGEI